MKIKIIIEPSEWEFEIPDVGFDEGELENLPDYAIDEYVKDEVEQNAIDYHWEKVDG